MLLSECIHSLPLIMSEVKFDFIIYKKIFCGPGKSFIKNYLGVLKWLEKLYDGGEDEGVSDVVFCIM